MSFLKKLIDKIGDIFHDLFDSAKRAYNRLSPEVKDALQRASGIVAIINDNVDKAPDFVFQLIQQKFPGLTEDAIKAALVKATEALTIAEEIAGTDDLMHMIGRIKDFLADLKTKDGTVWAKISHTMALGLAVVLSPKGTKLAALTSLIEYVYHDLIKGGK